MFLHPLSRVAAATAGLSVGALAACGGSGAGGQDVESVCSAFAAIEDIVTSDDPDLFVEALARVDEAAPDSISDATATVRGFMEESAAISELEGDEEQAAIEDFRSREAEFDEATEEVEDFARSNCPDLDESFFGS